MINTIKYISNSYLKMKSSHIKLNYPNSKELIRNIFNVNDEIMEQNKNDL